MKIKTFQNPVTASEITVGTFPESDVAYVNVNEDDAYAYNTRLAMSPVIFGEDGSMTSSYKRRHTILHKDKEELKVVDFYEGGHHLGYSLEQNEEKFLEELSLKAVESFINPTHITHLDTNAYGIESWAVYDLETVRKVVNDEGLLAIVFFVQPILMNRLTGDAYKTAMELKAAT